MHLETVLQFNNHFIVFIGKIINNYWFQFALFFNVRLNMTLKVSFHSALFQFISHLSTFSVLCCFFFLSSLLVFQIFPNLKDTIFGCVHFQLTIII